MRRFIEDFKMKNIAFLLLFFLLVSGHTNANAVGGSIGGWQVVSNVANGIGAKITATKEVMVNGASKVVTGTANITPKFTDVGRFMGRVGAAAIVTEAMNQILNGVDYVMDPANNTLTYKNKPADSNSPCNSDNRCSSSPTLFYNNNRPDLGYFSSVGPPAVLYAQHTYGEWFKNITFSRSTFDGQTYFVYLNGTEKGNPVNGVIVYVNAKPNPYYDPSAVDDNKSITVPLSNIGSQVIDQAEKDIRAGNPTSPAVALSRAVAQDMVAEAETDDVKARPIANQFEQTQAIPTDEDATGTIDTPEVVDPVTGEVVKPAETSSIAMKFPKACEWFPQACIFIDWAMTDPNVDSDMEVPEKEIEKQEIKKDLVKISGRSCPTDVKFDVDGLPFGIKINKAYSMQEICNTVEPLKYVFELITAVICALILLRV